MQHSSHMATRSLQPTCSSATNPPPCTAHGHARHTITNTLPCAALRPHPCSPTSVTHAYAYPTLRLATQLARTEEAAKRALLQTDSSARGGTAQKLLDAERALHKLRDENAELRSKLARRAPREGP